MVLAVGRIERGHAWDLAEFETLKVQKHGVMRVVERMNYRHLALTASTMRMQAL